MNNQSLYVAHVLLRHTIAKMSYDVLLTRPGPGRFTFNPNASSVQKDSSQAQHQQQPKDGQPNTNTSPKRESGTPARKISSSRFMAAFSQFYGNEDVEDVDSPGNTRAQQVQKTGDESFPEIKGRVESKLMSMWHNVKYGECVTEFVIWCLDNDRSIEMRKILLHLRFRMGR